MLTFANPAPYWVIALALIAIIALAMRTYAGARGLLSRGRWLFLIALRALALILLGIFLMKPVMVLSQSQRSDAIVPILIDNSRSMRLADVDGHRRIDTAKQLVKGELLPSLDPRFRTEILTAGEGIANATLDRVAADGRTSDLEGALAAVRDRYHGQRIAGIVLLSDGAETGLTDATAASPAAESDIPVFAVGMGAPKIAHDREIVGVSVGDPAISDSSVDLDATIVSHGFGGKQVELRVLENGRAVHVRHIAPQDDVPWRERFRVSPRQDAATVYSVELQADPAELTDENNKYQVLVRPPSHPRRILLVEGAPGFEHSFLRRALEQDRGLEVDSVVRKGKNDRGDETYYVQALKNRGNVLANGYPSKRDVLFNYDVVILANVEADLLTNEEMALTADFVAERGGGLLMLGGRSLSPDGLTRTPLEELMPVDASDRFSRASSATTTANIPPNKVALTPEGLQHPLMQLASSNDETDKAWGAMPALASSSPLGGAKPGASVLALTNGPGGRIRPLIATQRYGHGRTMVFGGEGAWRWRMGLPSANKTYETFWRQANRWLAAGAPDPIALTLPPAMSVGATGHLAVDVRDAEFHAVPDVSVSMRAFDSTGASRELAPVADRTRAGRFDATFHGDHAGLYRIEADVRRGKESLGTVRDWMLVGGADREMTDPRQNADVLQRLTRDSGGAMLEERDLKSLPQRLSASVARASDAPKREHELWHTPWTFGLVIGMVCVEWGFRRRWGLR
jgi:uncharacterized membrane protein